MKSITKQKNIIKEKTYPYLGTMKDNLLVVLFIRSNTGMVVSQGRSVFNVGNYSPSWSEIDFDYYNDIVELSN